MNYKLQKSQLFYIWIYLVRLKGIFFQSSAEVDEIVQENYN